MVLPGTSKADNVCSAKQFEQMSLFGGTSFESANIELGKFVKKHHRGFVIMDTKREYNDVTGQWYIKLQLMRKSLWQKTMAIFEAKEKAVTDAADRWMVPHVPEYKINGIQGVLW